MSHLLTLGILQQVQNAGGAAGEYDGDSFGFTEVVMFDAGTTYSETRQSSGNGTIKVLLFAGAEANVYLNNDLQLSRGVWDNTVSGFIEVKNGDNLKLEMIGNWFNTLYFDIYRSDGLSEGEMIDSGSWYDYLD